MGKADRKRWEGNVKSMEIIAKPHDQITKEDVEFLRQNYTSAGGLLPNAFSGGAFFTPTHVAKFIWQTLAPRLPKQSKVLEPSVGSGVFLEHAPSDAEITALELDSTSAKVTSILYPNAEIIEGDALIHGRRNYYDLIIGNPPYGVSVSFESDDEWQSISKKKGVYGGKSEVAFIELAIKAAKPGGYIAFVLPKGIAFGQAASKIRNYVRETCWHVATIELPGETFQHVGTSIKTLVVILRKVTPNARKVYVEYKTRESAKFAPYKWAEFTDESSPNAVFWYEGQQPVLQARVMDIGFDKDGKSTDKWGDGLTQLDELLEVFTDDDLVRSNLNPEPNEKKGEDGLTNMWDVNNLSPVHSHEQWLEKNGHLSYWNVLTLGRGDEVNGRSSWDFEWQDDIVAEWRQNKDK